MNIAIIGTGIAGLTAARMLYQRHELSVYEANTYIGGHTNTINIMEQERQLAIDTGFIVFNESNYPNLCRLFDALGVESRDSDMSFSVKCERSGLEYNGTNLRSLFVQKRNVFNPAFLKMLLDILRFHSDAVEALKAGLDDQVSVDEFVARHSYSDYFLEKYLVPLGASLWSCPAERFRHFPMRFVIEFLDNHHMLQVEGRPTWKTVVGGSSSYVEKLIKPFADRIHTSAPVIAVERNNGRVLVELGNGQISEFDEVILACHADQSLEMVVAPDAQEREMLELFQYQYNEAVLHTDTSVLPENPRAWASWNYRIPAQQVSHTQVSYNMNMLQGLDSEHTYCVSLNQSDSIDPDKVLRKIPYHHPVFQPGRNLAQSRHAELIQRSGLSYCGAYWGYGFHEDGVASAIRVAEALGGDSFSA